MHKKVKNIEIPETKIVCVQHLSCVFLTCAFAHFIFDGSIKNILI